MKTKYFLPGILLFCNICFAGSTLNLNPDNNSDFIRTITISYNPIIFLQDYDVEIDNNFNMNNHSGTFTETNFDPTFENSYFGSQLNIWSGHEVKLGFKMYRWLELGFLYYFYDCDMDLYLKEEVAATYDFTDGSQETFTEQLQFSYSTRAKGMGPYLKLILPVVNNENEDIWKNFSFDLLFQYGFSLNWSADWSSDYGVKEPVFPESFTRNYPDETPLVDWVFIDKNQPDKSVTNSKTNILESGIEFTYAKYFTLYFNYCYYQSLNKEDLYIENFYFEEGSNSGSHIKFPGNITQMSTLKLGVSLNIPLRRF